MLSCAHDTGDQLDSKHGDVETDTQQLLQWCCSERGVIIMIMIMIIMIRHSTNTLMVEQRTSENQMLRVLVC